MDITNNTRTSTSSWDLDMSMGNQLLLDHQIPFEFAPPLDCFPTHINNMPPQFIATQLTNPRGVEGEPGHEEEEERLGAMKEMMYKMAAMQPVDIDPSTIKKPKRRNVRISDDPQSIAARHRREKISEKIRILQRLVPGGTKMDTASMLDEAIRYVKFLKRQVQELQGNPPATTGHIGVLGGHPAGPPEWLVMRQDNHGSSSSSASAAGLGFHFPSDRMC